jgi:hypothetical protein
LSLCACLVVWRPNGGTALRLWIRWGGVSAYLVPFLLVIPFGRHDGERKRPVEEVYGDLLKQRIREATRLPNGLRELPHDPGVSRLEAKPSCNGNGEGHPHGESADGEEDRKVDGKLHGECVQQRNSHGQQAREGGERALHQEDFS